MKKLLILDSDIKKEMNFEEVYKQFEKLAYKRALSWKKHYDLDEMVHIATIGLWKAYDKYDIEKGRFFFGYADMVIINELRMYHRKNKGRFSGNSKIKQIVSMDSIVNDDGFKLEDILAEDDATLEMLADNLLLSKILDKFSNKQKNHIEAYINGYNQNELAKESDCNQSYISRQIKNTFMKFRALYIKEMAM